MFKYEGLPLYNDDISTENPGAGFPHTALAFFSVSDFKQIIGITERGECLF